ncbi:MAG: hypothetical protein R6X05_14410 [Desulfobacterales bacterium]
MGASEINAGFARCGGRNDDMARMVDHRQDHRHAKRRLHGTLQTGTPQRRPAFKAG